MALPKTIKIMHRNYSLVKETTKTLMTNQAYGMFKPIDGFITYVDDVSYSETVDTVIHEMLHALWMLFDHDKEHEEHIVRTLSTGLTTVMRDNPKLFAALQETLNGEGK